MEDKRHTWACQKWIVPVLGMIVLSLASTVVVARECYEDTGTDIYIRYLTTEDLELVPPYEYDVDKFLRALSSENNKDVYIAINRLVESFNNVGERQEALQAIKPLMKSSNGKIAEAAAFAVDILSEKYESPFLYKLSDGSIVFTLFNHYSAYGSQNVLWRIKDNQLEEPLRFSTPSMYITEIIPSPDNKLIAVITCSNKSEFVQIINVPEGTVSPELMESARVRYGLAQGLETWIRPDYENYSDIKSIKWKDNHTLQFEAMLAYNNVKSYPEVLITYDYRGSKIDIK